MNGRLRRGLEATAVVACVLFSTFAVLRLVVSGLFGADGNRWLIALLSLTPWLALVGLVVGVAGWRLRRRWAGGLALLLALLLVVAVTPRLLGSEQPSTEGPTIRVLASNVMFGLAEEEAVVELVATHDVDVLLLSELTPEMEERLHGAGAWDLLPHQVLATADDAAGSGIAARFPLEPLGLVENTVFNQSSARLEVEGATVELVAVHVAQPMTYTDAWHDELARLPAAGGEAFRLLAGDFNASLDHAAFRQLLEDAYADAATVRGRALVPTWPANDGQLPFVQLDHLLVDDRVAVTDFQVLPVGGSDHHAILTELRLP